MERWMINLNIRYITCQTIKKKLCLYFQLLKKAQYVQCSYSSLPYIIDIFFGNLCWENSQILQIQENHVLHNSN